MDWVFLEPGTARLGDYSLGPPFAQPLGVEGRPAVALKIGACYRGRGLVQTCVVLKRAWAAVLGYPPRLVMEDGPGWPFLH